MKFKPVYVFPVILVAMALASVFFLTQIDPFNLVIAAIVFVIDGGGSAITTGIKVCERLPFAGTILSAALGAPKESGSIVIDIWKCVTGSLGSISDSDSITASAPPTITTAQESLDATLTGWTKSFSIGDWIVLYVDSCTDITLVTLTLLARRT